MLARPVAQRLHLGAGEHQPGLEGLLQEVVEPRAAVLGDQLPVIRRHRPPRAWRRSDLGAHASEQGAIGRRTSSLQRPSGPGELGRRRRGVEEQRLVQARSAGPAMRARRASRRPGRRRRRPRAGSGRDVGGHRDAAVAAVGHVAQRRRVVARQHHPVLAARQPLQAGAGQVAGGVLDADDVAAAWPAAPGSRWRCRRWCGRARCRPAPAAAPPR